MEIIRYRTIEFYPNLLFETEIVIDNVIYYLSINVEKNKPIRTDDFEWNNNLIRNENTWYTEHYGE